MPFKHEQLWLGTQVSYEKALEAVAKAESDPKFCASSDYQEEVLKQIMQVQDGVATINISGSLINGSAGYYVYYGITGYDDIRNALVAAVSNPNVSAIMLNVSSGGGQVAGVHELAQLIDRVTKVKPVVTYNGSMMGSAAIWAGISASYVISAETAISGSVGIIMVHADKSKMYSDMGIKHTVIRAGAEKALASSYEPLSDKAKENLETQASDIYAIFIGHMAKMTDMTVTAADTKFGQGREFLGKQAVAVGLVDAVGTFEDAFAKAIKLGSAAKPTGKRTSAGMKASNSGNVQAIAGDAAASTVDNQITPEGTPMPKPLTQEQLAAMAAGVDLEAAADTSVTSPVADKAPETEGEGAADSSVQPTNVTATMVPEAALTVVQDMLKSTQAELVTAQMSAKTAEDKLAASADDLAKFAEIARASVKTMGIHFGVKSDAVAAMDNATVLAEHSRLSGLFKEKYKVGGVAASSTPTTDSAQKKSFMAPALASVAMSLPGAK